MLEEQIGKIATFRQGLGKDLFAQQGPAAEDALFTFLKGQILGWNNELGQHEPLAKTGNYPGLGEIQEGLETLRKFVEETDSLRFLRRFIEHRNELLDLSDELRDLEDFYTNQKHSWENLRASVNELSQNRLQLEAHEGAGPALARMEEILSAKRPYNMLHEVAGLTHTAKTVNDELVAAARGPAVTASPMALMLTALVWIAHLSKAAVALPPL